MTEIEWWIIVAVGFGPILGIIVLTLLSFKLLEVLHKMLETKFGTAIKRVVTLTIAGNDVNNIENIIKSYLTFSETADEIEVDRRLVSYAKKFLDAIKLQRRQIKLLEHEDMLAAKKEFFALLDHDNEDDKVLELTDVVGEEDHTFMLEEEPSVVNEFDVTSNKSVGSKL